MCMLLIFLAGVFIFVLGIALLVGSSNTEQGCLDENSDAAKLAALEEEAAMMHWQKENE